MKKPCMLSLRELSHIKIGEDASHLYFPKSFDDVINLYQKYHNTNKILPLGGCSNILFGNTEHFVLISDKYIPWKFTLEKTKEDNNLLTVSPNININVLIKKLAEYNLGGLEFLSGIPANMGGLVAMNAGAYQKQIGDYVHSVKVANQDGIKTFRKEDCRFSYRKSSINGFIVEITLNVEKIDKEIVLCKMKENIEKRKKSQPLNMPNIGCFFKNPENNSAGRLIDSCGLKGYAVGDAMVSYEHANFLINKGQASFKEMLTLIDKIKSEVKNKYNIDLELEIKVINE
ncbi:MAG TPA: UDP-N-acetylmuramate dehydrogenase [Candidatus Cloacimonadota bacterium]|nr:UDP-N-acetylmuramate dehydrogenase [Candidatus Cloacimonadota bacterium]HQB40267.1 UDP-N-acetylmuramate dehydrogenase [Candidatus Cloacimonadota bacterium]